MAGIQYLLTPNGQKKLNELIQRSYPNGINKSEVARYADLTRDTLNKVFNFPLQPVHKTTLRKIFRGLNQKLGELYRNEHCQNLDERQQDYEKRVRRELQSVLIPFQDTYCMEVADVQELNSSDPEPKECRYTAIPQSTAPNLNDDRYYQLAESLWGLNYTLGNAGFLDSLARLEPTGAFLLKVMDTMVQQWLVKRLVRQVPSSDNSRPIEMDMTRCGMDFELFWKDLGSRVGVSGANPKQTIAKFGELCQTKTVIIILSRFHKLPKEKQCQVIEQFWMPLVEQVRSGDEHRDWRSHHLVLFLIENSDQVDTSSKYPFEVVSPESAGNPVYPVRLQPLDQITKQDVQYWFRLQGFDLLTNQVNPEYAEQVKQQKSIISESSDPWTTLDHICSIFQTDLDDHIKPYWKLAG